VPGFFLQSPALEIGTERLACIAAIVAFLSAMAVICMSRGSNDADLGESLGFGISGAAKD
jgi:hypothetical protein